MSAVNEDQATIVRGTGAHALIHALKLRTGCEYVFGVPGHGAYAIYDSLNDVEETRPIVGRHEQGSVFGAIGYAQAKGSIGIAVTVPAAGVTNAATAILEATRSQDRLLFIVEADPMHAGLVKSVARHHARVDEPDELLDAVASLISALQEGRPGAAVLEVRREVLHQEGDWPIELGPQAEPRVPMDAVEQAVALLDAAENVVICAGASARGADAELVRLAERLGAPVFCDGFSRGVMPDSHPLGLGHSWAPDSRASRFLASADAVVVIGTPVVAAQNTESWSPAMLHAGRSEDRLGREVILVDWDDELQGNLAAAVRLRGHIPSILTSLTEGSRRTGRRKVQAEELKEIQHADWGYAQATIPWAVEVFEQLQAFLPEDGILLTDSLIGLWASRLMHVGGPRQFRFPFGTGTLGFGIPGAVGAKLACPESEVVVVAGDGAFLFNPQELATLALYGLKVTIVVANDDCYSAIQHNLRDTYGRSTVHELANPDFETLAQAFGMAYARVADGPALGAALREASKCESSTLIELGLALVPPKDVYDFSFTPDS